MVKYAEVKGYKAMGEISPHIYQWVELGAEIQKVIILRAYDIAEPTIFCGYIYETYTFKSCKIDQSLLVNIEAMLDTKVKIVTYINFIDELKSYKEVS